MSTVGVLPVSAALVSGPRDRRLFLTKPNALHITHALSSEDGLAEAHVLPVVGLLAESAVAPAAFRVALVSVCDDLGA